MPPPAARGGRRRTVNLWLALLLAVATPGSCSPREGSGGPGVAYARRMIELHNAGDEEAYGRFRATAFARQDVPEATWRERYRSLRQRFGRLSIAEIDSSDTRVVVHVTSERQPGARLQMEFELEPLPGQRIVQVGLAIENGGAPAAKGLEIGALSLRPDMSAAERTRALDGYLDDLARRDVFSGAIRIERNGRVLYEAARGMASRSYGVPNTIHTRFRIGSITKTFVQVVVARLIEQGRIDPSGTIGRYLPDYPNSDAASRVTVRHLLEHRAGLAELRFGEFARSANRRFRRPKDYFEFFAKDPLQFEPGTQERYSNAGYIVLGAIVEAVTGDSYEAAIQRAVYDPAGLTASGFHALDRVHPGVATGYWRCEGPDGGWCVNDGIIEIEGTPSGGSYGTVADLSRFYHALQDGRLLPDRWTQWIFTRAWPGEGAIDRSKWQAGWAGGAEGVSAVLGEQEGLLVIVLSNLDEPAGERVGRQLLSALGGA